MLVSQVEYVHSVLRKEPQALNEVAAAREVTIEAGSAASAWDTVVSDAAGQIGRVEKIELNISYDSADAAAMERAASQLKAFSAEFARLAEAAQPKAPPPSLSMVKTGTGMTIGAVGGYGVGLLLQEMGRLGQTTGNPYLSTAAVACTLIGTALGGGIGSGIIKVEVTGLGAKASSV